MLIREHHIKQYQLRRMASVLPILLGVSFITFCLIHLTPSDPAEVALRVNDIVPTPEAIAEMRTQLGLDAPFFRRYLNWLSHAVRLDFGNSFAYPSRTVSSELWRALPYTLQLAAAALVLTIGIALPLALLSAYYPHSFVDRIARGVIFIGTAMPSFWLGLLLIWLVSMHWNLLPTSGHQAPSSLILPTITLALVYIAIYLRIVRHGLLSQRQAYYVYYARARGLSERRILLKHSLRHALHTALTALGMSIAQLMAGTVVIENIFSWPGLGQLCYSAIGNRDYPVIQAYTLMMAVLFVFANLAVDIVHGVVDPRLRYPGSPR